MLLGMVTILYLASAVLVIVGLSPYYFIRGGVSINRAVWFVFAVGSCVASASIFVAAGGQWTFASVYCAFIALLQAGILVKNWHRSAWSELPAWQTFGMPLLICAAIAIPWVGCEVAIGVQSLLTVIATAALLQSTFSLRSQEVFGAWFCWLLSNATVAALTVVSSGWLSALLPALWAGQCFAVCVAIVVCSRRRACPEFAGEVAFGE